MNRLVSLILVATIGCASIFAQTIEDSIYIHFRQSKAVIDSTYLDNESAFKHAKSVISRYSKPNSLLPIDKITVIGAASPEGSVKINQRLSKLRADRIFDFFNSDVELPDTLANFVFVGRDWVGLRRLVVSDDNVPYRDDVIALLDEIIATNDGIETEKSHNLSRLKALHDGVPYSYMYNRLFPDLRFSKIILILDSSRLTHALPSPVSLDIDVTYPQFEPLAVEIPAKERNFYMALKTNMLYDALAVPNIGAEFYIGKNFSISGDWMYGWWDTDRRHRYWRAYGGELALRRWFGAKAEEKPLTGHHLGVYGGVVTYDFEFGGTGYMGGLPGRTLWDRCNWFAGIEYGYSLPVARRLNIDFSIGIGYLGGDYRVYYPDGGCYVWKETRKMRWFGPTKAEISLVWLIGHGNYNSRKGGMR